MRDFSSDQSYRGNVVKIFIQVGVVDTGDPPTNESVHITFVTRKLARSGKNTTSNEFLIITPQWSQDNLKIRAHNFLSTNVHTHSERKINFNAQRLSC